MTLGPQSMLAQYRLVDKIGEGGMGVVWRAVDTTLDREVAIKILPDSFARNEERLARFEREAKLLAALNHPNIAAIFGLHQTPEARFLSMELVAGEDLAERLARGPLAQEEALRVTLQVASALEAAHESGIIHRDLKPANVKLAPDGRVKVLDFGLAKVFGPDTSGESASPSLSPTITSAGTMAGTILGTAAYMSPEQAKGKTVDRRADIWAFGALLYETLCGRRLFEGETISETLAAVIMKEIRWDALPEDTPPRVRRLLRRCMQRDPQSRLRDIGDARLVLEETLAGADRDEAERTAARGERAGASGRWILAALLAIAGVAAGFATDRVMRPAAARPPLVKFAAPVEDLGDAAIAPDGKRLVYVSGGLLHVRDLDRLEPRELAGTDDAHRPFWSPDGVWIGYGASGKLWKVPASGGTPSVLCELPDGYWGLASGAAWLPNGSIVFTTGDTGLLSVNDQGGDPVSFLDVAPETEDDFHDASALPGGRGVLFVVHRKGSAGGGFDTIEVFAGKTRKTVIRMQGQIVWSPVYSPSGHVLFRRGPTNPGVWAVPFSLDTLETTGEPFLVAAGGGDPSVSGDGTLVYVQGATGESSQLVRASRDGKEREPIGPVAETSPVMVLSPDGSRVAIGVEEHGKQDLWIHDFSRGTRTRLTFDGNALMPAWSPDGARIAFVLGTNTSDFKLMLVAADGTGQPEELVPGWFPQFTPDGATLVYTAVTDAGLAGLWPHWSRSGDRLFYAHGDDLMEVPLSTVPSPRLGQPHKVLTRNPSGVSLPFDWPPAFDVFADGESFVFLEAPNGGPAVARLGVALNWFEEFRR
jgi:predicted Ser/Thr protein kinase